MSVLRYLTWRPPPTPARPRTGEGRESARGERSPRAPMRPRSTPFGDADDAARHLYSIRNVATNSSPDPTLRKVAAGRKPALRRYPDRQERATLSARFHTST